MSFYQEVNGFVIHQRLFSDSSVIIELFSQERGVIHILAKGIKKNKKLRPQLQPFALLKVQYFGRSQLKKMAQINVIKTYSPDGLINNTVGLYLNELIHHSLVENDEARVLFDCYEQSLSKLGQGKITPLLRKFEYVLLKHNGFELNVPDAQDSQAWLTVEDNKGLVTTQLNTQKLCQISDVENFLSGKPLSLPAQKRFNKLMVAMIDLSVSHRKLYARELLKSLLSR